MTITTDALARLTVERITKDLRSGDCFVEESARRVHRAALRSLARNLAHELRPHDRQLADLFMAVYDACPEVR